MRACSLRILDSHYKMYQEEGRVGRVELLPVHWHTALHGDATGVDRCVCATQCFDRRVSRIKTGLLSSAELKCVHSSHAPGCVHYDALLVLLSYTSALLMSFQTLEGNHTEQHWQAPELHQRHAARYSILF